MEFPFHRSRRLRTNTSIRAIIEETSLSAADFIMPVFVIEGEGKVEEINSMPGYYRRSIDKTVEELKMAMDKGIRAILLFVKVADDLKDNSGKESYNPDGLMQKAVFAIKKSMPTLIIMTDVALDPYSSYGHDGIVKGTKIVNDPTVEALVKMSISHAQAGADFVAPSDMMDGRIVAIRKGLEAHSFPEVGIMSYSAKYSSCYYGPFRDALDSAPGFGDKRTYQMNPANVEEAMREIQLDINEGADIVMVKPAMTYLDVIYRAKEKYNFPISAYQVSGEYAMIQLGIQSGLFSKKEIIWESLIAIKRAGADLIASYFALDFIDINKGR